MCCPSCSSTTVSVVRTKRRLKGQCPSQLWQYAKRHVQLRPFHVHGRTEASCTETLRSGLCLKWRARVVPHKMASPKLYRRSKLPTCHLTALCPKLFPDQSGKRSANTTSDSEGESLIVFFLPFDVSSANLLQDFKGEMVQQARQALI